MNLCPRLSSSPTNSPSDYRALFVKNLRYEYFPSPSPRPKHQRDTITDANHDSYNVTPEELFDLFGKFGPIRCVLPIQCGQRSTSYSVTSPY